LNVDARLNIINQRNKKACRHHHLSQCRGIVLLRIYSFSKDERIRKRSEFNRLKSAKQTIHNQNFIAVVDQNHSQNIRLGITVTKKVGSAVTRNRIKRIVRESFRVNKNQIVGHRDIHVIAKKSAALCASKDISNSLQQLFDELIRRLNY